MCVPSTRPRFRYVISIGVIPKIFQKKKKNLSQNLFQPFSTDFVFLQKSSEVLWRSLVVLNLFFFKFLNNKLIRICSKIGSKSSSNVNWWFSLHFHLFSFFFIFVTCEFDESYRSCMWCDSCLYQLFNRSCVQLVCLMILYQIWIAIWFHSIRLSCVQCRPML